MDWRTSSGEERKLGKRGGTYFDLPAGRASC